MIPTLRPLYETAGGTHIVFCERPDLGTKSTCVTFALACTDPCRFGPSPEAWGVEVLDFVFGR
jgi:hypothetical protein